MSEVSEKEKDLKILQEEIARFRDERDWKKYHDPKNLAMALAVETAELMEIFQWVSNTDSFKEALRYRRKVEEEMADILLYLLSLADVLQINLLDVAFEKLKKNKEKYPVAKCKGSYRKYTDL